MYTNIEALCFTPKTNIMLDVNHTSILKKRSRTEDKQKPSHPHCCLSPGGTSTLTFDGIDLYCTWYKWNHVVGIFMGIIGIVCGCRSLLLPCSFPLGEYTTHYCPLLMGICVVSGWGLPWTLCSELPAHAVWWTWVCITIVFILRQGTELLGHVRTTL